MLAVIFTATLSDQLIASSLSDGREFNRYTAMADQLRELAFKEYGCLNFMSTTEGNQEIALSYWQDAQAIARWKDDALHKKTQEIGRDKWYKEYKVEVVDVLKSYRHSLD